MQNWGKRLRASRIGVAARACAAAVLLGGVVVTAALTSRDVSAQATPNGYWLSSTLPAFRLKQQTSTVDPSSVNGAQPSPTPPVGGPRITALARGLEYNPDRIYQFVRNTIAFEPQFGLHKGAEGAVLDGSAGSFDQAQLMVELLRASGVGARYVFGTVNLNAAEADSVLRVSGGRQACYLLASAGMPALVNGTTNCASLGSGGASVQMSHVWVEANLGGTWYAFDPSIKLTSKTNGIDLWQAAGSTPSGGWGHVFSGVSSGQRNVTGVDQSGINAKLTTYASTLQAALAANHSEKGLKQLAGGWDIIRTEESPRTTSIANHAATASWENDVPAAFRATLKLEMFGADHTYDLASIYAHRLQAQLQNGGLKVAVRKCDHTDVSATAYFGHDIPAGCQSDNVVSLGSEATVDRGLFLTINHPYPAESGGYGDQAVVKAIEMGKRVDIIVRTAGGAGDRQSRQAAQSDAAYGARVIPQGNPRECLYPNPYEPSPLGVDYCNGTNAEDWRYSYQSSNLHVTGFPSGEQPSAEMGSKKDALVNSWADLFDGTVALIEPISGARIFQHHSLGVSLTPSYHENVLDIETTVAISAGGSDQPHHILSALAAVASGQEAAAISQNASDRSGGWMAGVNAGRVLGYSTTPLTRVNFGEAASVLPGEVTQDARDVIQLYLNNGYSVIASPGGFLARRADGAEQAWILRSSPPPAYGDVDNRIAFRKGAEEMRPNPMDHLGKAAERSIAANVAGSQLGSVDLRMGTLSFGEGTEVSVGQGEFPYSLGFSRSYISGGALEGRGDLGMGWTHNWESSARQSSDIRALLPEGEGVSGAPTLIAVLVALEAGRHDSLEASLVSGLAMNWWHEQATQNVVLLNGGGRSARFVRLANNQWRNPAAPAEQLTLVGPTASNPAGYSHEFDWTLSDRSVQRFRSLQVAPGTPHYDYLRTLPTREALVGWSFPTGVEISLTYDVGGNPNQALTNSLTLRSVENNLGAKLWFHHSLSPSMENQNACTTQMEEQSCHLLARRGGRLEWVGTSSADGHGNQVRFYYNDISCVKHVNFCAWSLGQVSQVGRRTRTYEYAVPTGAMTTADPTLYQPMLTRVTDDGIEKARFDWRATNGQVAPHVIEAFDALNRKTEYFSSGLTFSGARDAAGGFIHQAYDLDGRLITSSDAMWRTSRQTYDGAGRSRQVQTPWGNRTTFTYDNRGNIISTARTSRPDCGTDVWWCQSITVTAEYDPYWNKPTRIILPATAEGQSAADWNISYNDKGLEEVRRGSIVHDGRNNTFTHPQWKTWYDGHGRVIETEDPVGIRTAQVWGGAGQPAFCLTQSRASSQSGGLNLTTNMTCNAVGDVTSVTDPRNHTTTTGYDALRRKIDVVGPAGTNIYSHWVYDPDGNQTEAWAWDQPANTWRITRTSYSATGKPLTVTDPQGDVSRTCYDAVDRPTVTVDAAWRATKTSYNPAGQPTQIERWIIANPSDATCGVFGQLPAGQSSYVWRSFQYYAEGLQYAELDARGNATISAYDGLGRNVHTTFADGSWEFLFVNQRDQVIAKRSRSNEWRQVFYDNIGRITQIWENPNNPVAAAWANGRQSRVSYDPAGKVVYRDVSEQVNGVWDDGLLRDKRTYAHDAAGRVTIDVVQPFNGGMSGGQGLATGYGYDAASNRTSITWPGGYTALYQFDALNRPTRVDFGGNWATTTYDSLSRRTAVSRSNNTSTAWAYEPDGDLFTATHNFPAWPGQVVQSYAHDPAGKLTGITHSRDGFEWQPADGYARSYGVANVLNQATSQGGVGIGWDANGNMTSDGVNSYGWAVGNRLAGVTRPGMSAAYVYDSEDRRTAKTVDGVMTRTLWSGTEPIAQYDTNGALLRLIIPDGSGAMDGRVAVVENGGDLRWQHTDHQGSVIVLTDGAGTVRQINRYGPHGETSALGGSTGVGGIFGYTGREFDPESGLYQYRARYYSPLLGLFLSTDPIGTKDDPNLYLYTGGDPVNHFDPTGRSSIQVRYRDQAIHYRGITIPQIISGGHSGVVSINDRSGSTVYREFGRYDGRSQVRERPIADFQMDERGIPTARSVEAALNSLLDIGSQSGVNNMWITYSVGTSSVAMDGEVYRFQAENPQWSATGPNCHTFCESVAEAGETGRHVEQRFWVARENVRSVAASIRGLHSTDRELRTCSGSRIRRDSC